MSQSHRCGPSCGTKFSKAPSIWGASWRLYLGNYTHGLASVEEFNGARESMGSESVGTLQDTALSAAG